MGKVFAVGVGPGSPKYVTEIVKEIVREKPIYTTIEKTDKAVKKDLLALQSDYSEFRKKTAKELSEFSMAGKKSLQDMKKEINKQNEERIKKFEAEHNCRVTRLTDQRGLALVGDKVESF